MEIEQNRREQNRREQNKKEQNKKEKDPQNLNEKVLAMYRAVWELIDEGQDVHNMKVADITSRAGIGKGTAYEYFRSKEEIVTKAMRYDFLTKFRMLEKQIQEMDSFSQVIETCFLWLAENAEHRRFALQFMKKSGQLPMQEGWGNECACSDEGGCGGFEHARQVIMELVQIGKKDGSIRREISDHAAALQILSQFLGFFIYLEFDAPEREEINKTKQFLYGNMIKSLS